MTKHWTVLVTASLATLLAIFAPTPLARADIFQWEYINPANPSQGKQPSTTLTPDGAGVCRARHEPVGPQPDDGLPDRRGSQFYLLLIAAARFSSDLTGANLSQADLTGATLEAPR